MSDPFAEIRPYRDEEVLPVLRRLVRDPEFLGAIASLRFGRAVSLVPWLVRPLVALFLRWELRNVKDVQSLQDVIKRYMDRMIGASTGGFSVSGLEQLPTDQAYLFMSNHRDIAMDPAFTNYALYREGRDTVRIAIGDNLLTKPWVSDSMRLNKSFIVKRALSGPRQLLAATKILSGYIRHSLREENSPIWIAQREGRAKDGVDQTEPAIIKMLAMSRDKRSEEFAAHIGNLGIVPVAISYELDPCDAMKAAELWQVDTQGSYEKGEQEDVASIGQGIAGNKGRVHVSFGTPLAANLETPGAVADEVDRQVRSLYCLHPTNVYAYRMLHGEDVELPDDIYLEEGDCSRAEFEARIQALPAAHRPYALAIYANAVSSKLALDPGAAALAD
ncbi:MAG: 1-acyl-sn-glycerol-3-phosphate acyltransferase [Halioglobus sp.]